MPSSWRQRRRDISWTASTVPKKPASTLSMSFGKEITCPEVHSTSTCVTHRQNWNVTVGIQQCSKPHWLSSLILWLNVGYRLSKHNLRLFHKDKKDRKGVNVLIMKVFMGLNRAVSRKRWRSARNIANRKTFVNVCGPQRNSVWVYVRVWGKCDKYLGADMDDDTVACGENHQYDTGTLFCYFPLHQGITNIFKIHSNVVDIWQDHKIG